MAVHVGIHMGQQNMTMADMRAAWRDFDQAGIDWISLWDHLYEAPPAGGTVPHFEAVASLGALAADTSNARLGCLVFCVGYRNLGLLAKAAITVDHISGGRFELGVGAGWHEQEAAAFGFSFPSVGRRLDLLEESLPVLKDLFAGLRVSHAGDQLNLDDAAAVPAPVRGELPIWVGGTGERRTLPMTARWADGWNAAYIPPEAFGQLNSKLDELCASVDRPSAAVQRSVNLMFMPSRTGSVDEVEIQLRSEWGDLAPRLLGGALTGTLAQMEERMGEYVAAGADQVNLVLRAPWDHGMLSRLLERLPALRAGLDSMRSA